MKITFKDMHATYGYIIGIIAASYLHTPYISALWAAFFLLILAKAFDFYVPRPNRT